MGTEPLENQWSGDLGQRQKDVKKNSLYSVIFRFMFVSYRGTYEIRTDSFYPISFTNNDSLKI